ncbi:MAG TPA: FxLYD domain-containing protein [Thermoanaerobaculia bacterium]|nr:FxLYD domain-containing protein [Thermoanaerobaculia bacterium]
MQHKRPTAALLGAAFLALAAAAPAAADWLVTREGGRVETKGPWQVKGKLVVFTTADGKLSSLRLSEVDLDASRHATEEAVAAAKAAPDAAAQQPAKPREAKVVLTDESFRHTAPPADSAAPGDEKPAGETAPAADDDKSKLAVASWERVADPGDGHVVVTGTVRNDAPDEATGVAVTVLLYDETGKLLVSGEAVMSSTILPAGQSGSFRADFPDIFSFAATKFEARGMHILRRPGGPPKSADGN